MFEGYENVLITVSCIGLFMMFILGIACGTPNELENGCIIYNDKVYCEEVNKVED